MPYSDMYCTVYEIRPQPQTLSIIFAMISEVPDGVVQYFTSGRVAHQFPHLSHVVSWHVLYMCNVPCNDTPGRLLMYG